MGNKMSCCCRREADHPVEEIPMETFYESEIPEEPSNDLSDSSDYVEMRPHSPPIYVSLNDLRDSPKDDTSETYRLRIMAEHYFDSNMERRQFYDVTVPMNSVLENEYMECLFHISLFNGRKERIMDLTYYNDLKPNFKNQHITYWKNSRANSWTLNYSWEGSPRSFKQCELSSVRKVLLYAMAVYDKKDSEVQKLLFLSKKPATTLVPTYIKRSAECVLHLTAYNAQLMTIFDLVLIQGKDAQSNTIFYLQSRDPRTDRTRQFSVIIPDGAGPFWSTFT